MKKPWFAVLTAAVLTLSACGGGGGSAVPTPDADSVQSAFAAPDSPSADAPERAVNLPDAPGQTAAPLPSEGLTEAEARRIALEHAGVSENDVAFIRTDKERDDGRMEYAIEFSSGATKYEYTIDAETGAILSFEAEDAKGNVAFSFDAGDAPPSGIGQDEAKAIALAHAGVSESDATRLKVELDRDDGRMEYEVEFDVGRTEYSYEIDAVSGEILSYEIDND